VLCAVGDLIEDVVVHLHGEVRRDTDTPATVARRRGGSAANVAYFAAKLSGRARFVGCVGDDPLGSSLIERLRAVGVDVAGERKGRTGSIVIIAAPDGDRTMLTDRGDAMALSYFESAWLDDITTLHVPLYSFSHEPIALASQQAVRIARIRAIPVSLDLSSVTLLDQMGAPTVRRLIESIEPDTLFCTTAEADAIGLRPGHCFGARAVILKDGPRPIRVIDPAGVVSLHPINAVTTVVDSTGAGDAFAAGFLCLAASDATVDARVRAGHSVASRVITQAGATLEDET